MQWFVLGWVVLTSACGVRGSAPTDAHELRRVVALIDYVAADYGGAVRDGQVADESEYKEQLAFLKEAGERAAALPTGKHDARGKVQAALDSATRLAMARAPAPRVAEAMRSARDLVIRGYDVELGPSLQPSSERGRALFAQMCATCHGASGGGDGPAAANLQPRPRSFRDPAVTTTLSPVRAFSAISDGVAGTAMVSFESMPDADRWALAFYVTAIHHDPVLSDGGRLVVDGIPVLAALDFTTLADLRDMDIEARLRAAAIPMTDQAAALAFLRTIAPFQPRGSVADIRKALAASKEAYASGDAATARHALTDAYLDGFEPLEARLLVTAPELVRRIEDQFLALREGAEHGIDSARFASGVDTLLVQLEAVETRLRGATSPWSATLAAFVVVIREGVESVLLVVLLLGLAKRAGADADRRAIHVGWGVAIAVGVVTWFASSAVVALGGGNRELVEGMVAILAVVVLLYAGHFVLARMDAQRRIAALKRRFTSIPAGRRRLLLFTFSFVATYREAFEVVLFLRAIVLGSPSAGGHVAVGSMLGLGACITVFAVTARVGKRLNASLLLNIGGVLLCVLAFVLAGKGMRSLQEAGLVGVSTFDGPRSDLLGVFPTWQTLAAQVMVIAFVLVIALLVPRRSEFSGHPAPTESL
jgi:high-affinity iron transporter